MRTDQRPEMGNVPGGALPCTLGLLAKVRAIQSTSRNMAIRSKVSRITENAGQLPRALNNFTGRCKPEWTSAAFIGGPDLITSNGGRDGAILASFMSTVRRRSGTPINRWHSCEIASLRAA